MEVGPESDAREPLNGIDFAYGNTSFEIRNFEKILNLNNRQTENLLDARLIDQPVSRLTLTARQTEEMGMFLPSYCAVLTLNPEFVDSAWIEECLQNYVGAADTVREATDTCFTVEKTDSPGVLVFSSIVTGSQFNVGVEHSKDGVKLIITNGDPIISDDTGKVYSPVPMLKSEIQDEELFQDFLEIFSFVMQQTPRFAYSVRTWEEFEHFPPNFYVLQADPDEFPVLSKDGEPLRHYPVWTAPDFSRIMRELVTNSGFIDHYLLGELEERIAAADDFEAATDLNARQAEIMAAEEMSLVTLPGLRKSEFNKLFKFAARYIDPSFANIQLRRGIMLIGEDELRNEEIAEVLASSIGADFLRMSIDDIYENCTIKSPAGIIKFFEDGGFIPRTTNKHQKINKNDEADLRQILLYIEGLGTAFGPGTQDWQRARVLSGAIAESLARSPNLVIVSMAETKAEIPLSMRESDVFGRLIPIKIPNKRQREELLSAFLADGMMQDAIAEKFRVYDLAQIDFDQLVERMKGLTATEMRQALAVAEVEKYQERNRGDQSDPITTTDIERAIGQMDN